MPDNTLTENQTRASNLLHAGVYKALVTGMIASTVLFAIGTILSSTGEKPLRLVSGWPAEFYSFSNLWQGLRTGDPIVISAIGTVALILTPISRLFVSLIAFIASREYKFVAITALVAATVVLSIILGVSGVLR